MTKGRKNRIKVLPWKDLKRAATAAKSIGRSTPHPQSADYSKIRLKVIVIEACLIALLAMVVYAPSFSNPFVLTDNFITGAFAANIAEANFWSELLTESLATPLSQPWLKASFAIDCKNFGDVAFWYRLVNLILHIASCIYLYLLSFRISRHLLEKSKRGTSESDNTAYNVAFVASLLFACHPFCSGSIAYIGGREGVLTGANTLLALNLFLWAFWSDRVIPIILGYLGCFFCAIMALETSAEGVAVPMLLLASAFILHRSSFDKSVFEERALELFILSILSFILPFTARLPFSCAFGSNFGIPPLLQSVYLASQFKGFLTYYLRCSVLPFGLSIEPPFFVSPGWADPYAALGLGALFILGFLIFLKKEDRFLAFSLAVVGLGYLPSLLISRSEYVNDGRFYIPLVGVCLVLARVLYSLVKKAPLIGRTALVSTIILLASLTFWREAAWGSSLEVWKAANQLHRSAHSEAMIALLKIKSVNAEEARSQALSLIQKYPDCQPAYLALAVYENSRGDFSSSAGYFARALRLCHEQHLNDQTYFTTATLCLRNLVELDDYTFPLEEISTLIANYSGCAEVNYLAGRLALHQNKPMVAVRYLDKAFSLDRVNPDYVEALAQACVDSEDDKLIENAYKSTRYISLRVPSPTLRIICAQAALEMGRPDQCIEFVSKAINVFDKLSQAYAIRPKLKAKAYYLKSIALSTIGKTIESEAAQKEALHYDPAVVSHVRIKIVGKDQSSSASSEKNSGVRFPPKTL